MVRRKEVRVRVVCVARRRGVIMCLISFGCVNWGVLWRLAEVIQGWAWDKHAKTGVIVYRFLLHTSI